MTAWGWVRAAGNVAMGVIIFLTLRFLAAGVLGLYPIDTYGAMNDAGGLYGILPGHDVSKSDHVEIVFAMVAGQITVMWVKGTHKLPVRVVIVTSLLVSACKLQCQTTPTRGQVGAMSPLPSSTTEWWALLLRERGYSCSANPRRNPPQLLCLHQRQLTPRGHPSSPQQLRPRFVPTTIFASKRMGPFGSSTRARNRSSSRRERGFNNYPNPGNRAKKSSRPRTGGTWDSVSTPQIVLFARPERRETSHIALGQRNAKGRLVISRDRPCFVLPGYSLIII